LAVNDCSSGLLAHRFEGVKSFLCFFLLKWKILLRNGVVAVNSFASV